MMKNENIQLYLASTSPRRKELLSQIDVCFTALSVAVDEQHLTNESPRAMVERLALEKARAGWFHEERTESKPVLGADTIVVVDEKVLGKPKDKADAMTMLELLSGRENTVITAVALVQDKQEKVVISETLVKFCQLSQEDMEWYWQTGEAADKAGAYGLQGKAAIFIKAVVGSVSGVIGLPLYETQQLLKSFGVKIQQ